MLIVSALLRELMLHRTSLPEAASPASRPLHAVLLDQLQSSAQQPIQLPTTDNETLAKVCAALQDDPADVHTLSTVAAHAHVSERTLSRIFRTELGMTFPQWRTQVRLFDALQMLAAGTSLTVTAHAWGWSSTSVFIDVFRSGFGHTPGTHKPDIGVRKNIIGMTRVSQESRCRRG